MRGKEAHQGDSAGYAIGEAKMPPDNMLRSTPARQLRRSKNTGASAFTHR